MSFAWGPGEPFYANKRWGHGRLRQLAVRLYCRLRGHEWRPPWEGLERCRRPCGGMRRAPAWRSDWVADGAGGWTLVS